MTIENNKRASTVIREALGHISFGDMIISYRVAQEITQVKMSSKLGISKQELCNIEKGRKVISVERAVSFAKALTFSTRVFAKYALQDQLHKAGLKGEVIIRDVC